MATRPRSRSERRGGRAAANSDRLPDGFLERIAALLPEGAHDLVHALGQPPVTAIRVHPRKSPQLLQLPDPVPWCANGRYLEPRPAFTFDPLLHAGGYYVQDPSTMLLEQALLATGPWPADTLALDLCAAPGGKSTHLRALLPEGALLVANEVDGARREALLENLWKQGLPNVVVTGADPGAFAESGPVYDLVVADAPCSGEGLFRREAEARRQWSPALVDRCAAVQRHILHHAWAALAPGGTLIWSTCTWEPAENEEQVATLLRLGARVVDVPVPPASGVERVERLGVTGLRCMPHRVRGEGFYMAVVRKPGPASARRSAGQRCNGLPHGIAAWMKDADRWCGLEHRGIPHAVDRAWSSFTHHLCHALPVTMPGIPLAEERGGQQLPHPALALSTMLDPSAFTTMDLDERTAERYLRGESLPAHAAYGDLLLRWQGLGLGWARGAGGRWNNRWPKPWRLRSHRPSAPPVSWPSPHPPGP